MRVRPPRSSSRDDLAVVLGPAVRAVAARDGIGGPLGAAVLVTGRARIRRPDRQREARPRNADGMVAPRVDQHVGPRGHVALDARRAVYAVRMAETVGRAVGLRAEPGEAPGVGRALMAAHAERVALGAEPESVWLVAVRAAHARLVHPTLAEGAVFVDFAELLSVGVVEIGGEDRGEVVVVER